MENLSPQFYQLWLKVMNSSEKCDVPPPTYCTFTDSHLSPCYVGSSIGPEAHSCDKFVSQPWFAIQKWCYYTTKQFVKPPDKEASLQDAVGLQRSSEEHCLETSSGGGSWQAGTPGFSVSHLCRWETWMLQEDFSWSEQVWKLRKGQPQEKREYEKKTLTSAETDCSLPGWHLTFPRLLAIRA